MSLPGQPTEEAAAEVASEAGKSLVRGFANLAGATFDNWIATKQAKAMAARLAIETDARIASETALTGARRQFEVSEIEHQAVLHRRLDRMRYELEREQLNLEAIQMKALEFAEEDPDRNEATEVDQDWLFRVADLAQKISDKDVQELWARAITSAAIKGTKHLSANALQTLSLLDKKTAEDFRSFVMILQRLGFYPVFELKPPLRQCDPQSIDLGGLVDLGLIQHQTTTDSLRLTDFEIAAGHTANIGLKLFNDRFIVTKRGAEIANAVFRGQKFDVADELEQKYLQNVLAREIHNNRAATILLPGSAIVLRPPSNGGTPNPSLALEGASPRLQKLLTWASSVFSIEVLQVPANA
jgi:hypothetical protein